MLLHGGGAWADVEGAEAPVRGTGDSEDPQSSAPSASTEEVKQAAREHYQRGITRFDEGSYTAALEEFQAAYSLAPNYRILYNIALVGIKLEDHEAAHRALAQYMNEARDELPEDQRTDLQEQLDELAAKLGTVILILEDPRTTIAVDGKELENGAPEKLWLAPGQRVLGAEFPDGTTKERVVTIRVKEQQIVDFTNTERPTQPKRRAPARSRNATKNQEVDASPSFPIVPWVVTGALAAGATTFGILALRERREEEAIQDKRDVAPVELDQARTRVERTALITDILVGLSAASAIVSTYVTIEWANDRERVPRRTELRPTANGLLFRTSFH